MIHHCALFLVSCLSAASTTNNFVDSSCETQSYLIGDFDFDGDRDGDDADLLTTSGDLSVGYKPVNEEFMYDIDHNGWVDLYDLIAWLGLGTKLSDGSGNGGTIIGDADLDGDVDREDLGILNNSLSDDLVVPGRFTQGDFNGDGEYDLEDYFLWNRAFQSQ